MRIHRAAGILVVSLATIAAGCEGDHGTGIGFSTGSAPFVAASPIVGATLVPRTIGFTPVASRCPSIGPFLSSFSLFVDQRTSSDIFLDHIDLQFADHSGRRSALQFTHSDLTQMFGTTLVSAGAARTFDFSARFGCDFVSVPAVLIIDLVTLTRSG